VNDHTGPRRPRIADQSSSRRAVSRDFVKAIEVLLHFADLPLQLLDAFGEFAEPVLLDGHLFVAFGGLPFLPLVSLAAFRFIIASSFLFPLFFHPLLHVLFTLSGFLLLSLTFPGCLLLAFSEGLLESSGVLDEVFGKFRKSGLLQSLGGFQQSPDLEFCVLSRLAVVRTMRIKVTWRSQR
jgi:hypothetical protein